MASDLLITIQESITLPNGNKETLQNTKTISGITQTLRRVDTIATTPSGSGIEILRFTDSEAQQTAGSFVKSNVKYVRITNLDTTNSVNISIVNEDQTEGEFVIFTLEAGKSLMFNNANLGASQPADYVLPGIWDEMYYGYLEQADVIKARATTAAVQLEYFVAST